MKPGALLLRLLGAVAGQLFTGRTLTTAGGLGGAGVAIFGDGTPRIGGLALFVAWLLAVHFLEAARVAAGAQVAAAKAAAGPGAGALGGLLGQLLPPVDAQLPAGPPAGAPPGWAWSNGQWVPAPYPPVAPPGP